MGQTKSQTPAAKLRRRRANLRYRARRKARRAAGSNVNSDSSSEGSTTSDESDEEEESEAEEAEDEEEDSEEESSSEEEEETVRFLSPSSSLLTALEHSCPQRWTPSPFRINRIKLPPLPDLNAPWKVTGKGSPVFAGSAVALKDHALVGDAVLERGVADSLEERYQLDAEPRVRFFLFLLLTGKRFDRFPSRIAAPHLATLSERRPLPPRRLLPRPRSRSTRLFRQPTYRRRRL